MAGKGENAPTVQSAFDGSYYLRSVPSEDFGTKGKTQVFRVKNDGDELLDEYPVYMRGELYLGWSSGKLCLIHLEPERISSEMDFDRIGKVSRLVFYMGGKEILSYTGEELKKLGLERKVSTLKYKLPGQFMIHGIKEVPLTNHYVLSIEKNNLTVSEEMLMDITTGKVFSDYTDKK